MASSLGKQASRSVDGEEAKNPATSAKRRSVCVLDRQSIEAKALAYLDKFDASTTRLRRILSEFVRKRARELGVDPAAHLQTVEETLVRYQHTGLIDDRRYATSMTQSLITRGASRQAIRTKLHARGIAKDTIEQVLQELGAHRGSELTAARALVRKRRLGHYRPTDEQREHFRRDLGILARAGFDFETARRALSLEGEDDENVF
jgi:regulatory protein